MNIITISREFGSGGRELGKRLADILDYTYYDREIETELAKRTTWMRITSRKLWRTGRNSIYLCTLGELWPAHMRQNSR